MPILKLTDIKTAAHASAIAACYDASALRWDAYPTDTLAERATNLAYGHHARQRAAHYHRKAASLAQAA